MITGDKSVVDPYANIATVRQDFLRRVVLGGVGECIWNVAQSEMLVNAGGGAITFSYGPPLTEDWVVHNVLVGYICPVAATAIEFGTSGAPLANGINFRLANATEMLGLAVINVNGDFAKIGTPGWAFVGPAATSILTTWVPDRPIQLRGNLSEQIQMVINDNLTGAPMGTTLWAIARGFKYAG